MIPAIRTRPRYFLLRPRRLGRLLAPGILLLAALPARAAAPVTPVFEADALVVRFAPANKGLAIRADRIAWRDSSGALHLRDVEARWQPGRIPGRSALSVRARAAALGEAAPPLPEIAISGTLLHAAAGKAWRVPDLLLRIAGREALAGAITGAAPASASSGPGESEAFRIELASRGPLNLAPLAPALARAGAKGWRASGSASIMLSAHVPASVRGPFEGRAAVSLRGFGFSTAVESPDLAADGLDGRLSLTLRGTLSPRRLRFDLEADASDFEFLSGVYYANLAGRSVTARASGSLRGTRIEGLDARVTAPDLGTIRIAGALTPGSPRPGDEIRVDAERVELGPLWRLAVSEPLGDSHPFLHGSAMRGSVRLDARWRRLRSGWTLEGLVQAGGLRWERPAAAAVLDVAEVRLPFHFRSPSRRVVPEEDPRTDSPEKISRYGKIRVARFQAGSWIGEKVLVEPLIHESGLRLRGPAVIPFYGGAIRVEDLEGSDLLQPDRRIRFHGRVAGVDLGALTRGLGLPEFRGRLDGEMPEVRIDGDHLRAPGRFETGVFGGRITVSRLEVARLFSRLPRIGMDVTAREIGLARATQALALGRISGTLEGSIRGLVIERGQPESFFADFSVVDRKGVDKWVSADFVEDVGTLFGSGNAVSNTLNRGVNRFFERYRYDGFGFTCGLKNDVFYPRGKIRRDGIEYLMWGRWNYVRIAMRDPGRGIPFSFLVRQMRVLATSPDRVEQRSRTPLHWLWPPSWRATPGGRSGAS